jgi:hypothetical protein
LIDPYILVLVGAGALILLVAWLPMLLKELPLSLPMFCVGFGWATFALSVGDLPVPLAYPELVVIIALTGTGLKLDRPFGWRSWSLTWRLLAIAMPCRHSSGRLSLRRAHRVAQRPSQTYAWLGRSPDSGG